MLVAREPQPARCFTRHSKHDVTVSSSSKETAIRFAKRRLSRALIVNITCSVSLGLTHNLIRNSEEFGISITP
jgi:hypothetical protein